MLILGNKWAYFHERNADTRERNCQSEAIFMVSLLSI